MGLRSNDIRALVILAVMGAITGWCYLNAHPTLTYVFGGSTVILTLMFARVIYLREVTKTYVSRFDKIEVLEEENDGEAEEN